MHYIDLIIGLILAYAVYNGWRQGVIIQVCSIIGILCGVWLATRYGALVGGWLHISSDYASVGGFLVVLIAVIVCVAIASRLLRKVCKFAGLGILDIILGIALSVCKFAVILSVLFGAFNGINKNTNMVSEEELAKSKLYHPIININDIFFPTLEWTQKQISSGIEKL